ncbi:hypothetical protein O3P69_005488 [Scylla paramamosain]|uniref:Rapamycin-insensitive companion of mTOR n=1 Tax=Scylla paramamosain TaxID=85552 RepID=A0AAW0U9S1_SCYPA
MLCLGLQVGGPPTNGPHLMTKLSKISGVVCGRSQGAARDPRQLRASRSNGDTSSSMYHGRAFRAGRPLRKRQDSEDEIQLDTGRGVSGVLREVLSVVCQHNGIPKSRRLGYLNEAVRAIVKILSLNQTKKSPLTEEPSDPPEERVPATLPPATLDFGEEEFTREQYFCLLRCCLVQDGREIRAGGLRLLRYLIFTKEDVQALMAVNVIPLIIRCMDIMLDNQVERVQALRLARRLLMVAPDLFPLSLARCLVAIARDGAKERDRLLRSALATLNEMAILNTQVFVECGGVGVVLHNVLDCAMPRINEALLGAILYLLNTPQWRPHCSELHQILAPFSDFNYKHTSYDLDYYSKSEERELRTQAAKLAVLVCLRSWPGLVSLCQPSTAALKSLVALLYPNHEETRKAIIELLYELFRVPLVDWTGDYDEALATYKNLSASDTDLWRLHESFVAAEARAILPHIAKYRPNVIQNHLALVLYTMMCVDLFPALCEVIVSSSAPLSVRTTLLLGELLHQANQNLPGECGSLSHCLPLLLERAAGSDSLQRMRATQAITALLMLSRSKLSASCSNPTSLYLAQIINAAPKAKDATPKRFNEAHSARLSKWLGKDHDELISQTMKDSHVLIGGQDPHVWKWELIIAVLRWPSLSLHRLEESNYRLFRGRHTHDQAQVYAQTLLHFCDFLLGAPEDECIKYLEELLVDISTHLSSVLCERPAHDVIMSPSHLNTTTAQYYFLALGRLTHSAQGHEMLMKSGILEQLQELVSVSESDMYAKLVSTCLHYSGNKPNRAILTKILTGCQESARLYGTQLLRAFARVGAEEFAQWGMELLVGQLYDESRVVSLAALEVLDEACDNEEYLEAVLCAPPSVTHLGDRGQLLLVKLVSSPRGFRAYQEANFINTMLDKWATTYSYKYVRMMQLAIADSITQHQRGEDGQYGRRTGSKHVVHDVFLMPHLYGSLTQHKEGFAALMQHEAVKTMVQVVKTGATSTPQEIFQLKVAVWAMGHIGLSSDGAGFLSCEGVLRSVTHLAASCPVYSVRGVCFHALCLVATTKEGVTQLRKYGWECVQRNHHEQWQMVDEMEGWSAPQGQVEDPYFGATNNHHVSESEVEDLDLPKAGFYVGDDSEDGSDGGSILVEGIGLDDAYPAAGKSQTLPHKSKPPSAMCHKRSFSDCAPVLEELTSDTSQIPPSHDDLSVQKRSSLRFRFLASMRRKSERRRESTSSRASNSSTASERMTDRMTAFLQSARRIRGVSSRSHSLTDPTGSDEETGEQPGTLSSDSLSDPADVSAAELPHDGPTHHPKEQQEDTPTLLPSRTQVECRLSPIASGTSLVTLGSQSMAEGSEFRRGGRGGSIRGSSGALFAEDAGDRGWQHHPNTNTWLRGGDQSATRRVVSESSHEEKPTRNSLKGFLSSSYEHGGGQFMSNLLDVQGLVRSPSGCSEVSSVRSGVRGIGLGPSSSSRALGSYNLIGATQHQAGQCYIGFALPLDLDLLLYDASLDKNVGQGEAGQMAATGNTPGKDRFPAITESELETQSEEDPEKKKAGSPKKKTDDTKTSKVIHGNGLELHSPHSCLACYTLTPPTPPPTPKAAGEGEGEAPEADVVLVSPPLQRVKAISEASEASDPSSVNSQGWEDTGGGEASNTGLPVTESEERVGCENSGLI